jgi:hypothetical protein
MRAWPLLLVVGLFSLSASADQEPTPLKLPHFPYYYGVVSHVLKHDKGCYDQLMASEQRDDLSEFWWGYILRLCDPYVRPQMDFFVKRHLTKEKMDQEVRDLTKQCAMGIIFDNWDRINATIVEDTKACEAKRK